MNLIHSQKRNISKEPSSIAYLFIERINKKKHRVLSSFILNLLRELEHADNDKFEIEVLKGENNSFL